MARNHLCQWVLFVGLVAAGSTAAAQTTAAVQVPGKVRLVLPPVMHAVVGSEANLYFDNVVLVLDRADYAFDAICEKGNQLDERWTFTPTPKDVGSFPLEVMVRDESNEVIARGSTVVRVVPKESGTAKVTTLLLVGASLTEYSIYPQELLDLDSRDEHLKLKLIGSRGKGDGPPKGELRHEGYSGWTAQAFVIFAGPLSRSGIYKRPDTGSPFVYEDEPGKKHLDFGRYCKEFNDGKAPDALTIHLGPNDIFTANDETIDKRAQEMIGFYDQLIEAFHKFAPEMRIGVILTAAASRSQDGFRNYIGAGRQSRWQYRRNIHRAWEMMIKHYAGAEKRNVYLVPSYVNFDTERHFPTWTAPANARATQSLVRIKNGTHPSPEGYQQMADAIYCWLKAMNASEQASQ